MTASTRPTSPLPVALFGATGLVGSTLTRLLDGHPWLRLEHVFASPESAGQTLQEALPAALADQLPAACSQLRLESASPERLAGLAALGVRLAFSALDSDVAGPLESAAAQAGLLVCSNAASHRLDPLVPLVVPEVNPEHLALLAAEPGRHEGRGAIVTNPNCTTVGLTMVLGPLAQSFGLRRVSLVSLQARSGAGLQGGGMLALEDNLVPFIEGEEPKLTRETQRILGALRTEPELHIEPATLPISATCTRVPVLHGHTLCVSLELDAPATRQELREALQQFRGRPQELGLPSAPQHPVQLLDDIDGPQPARHVDLGRGMSVAVGRLRPDPLFGEPEEQAPRRGWRLVTLSHNLVRGAAGGALLNAELALATGALRP